ncbi:glycosyltransferase [Amnibacterium setariae]|uniref:glycosyltransferase n=1 Tax=Amnibacterium setariae TaxID=2306585 RepID=UPI0013141488|nr:glycosyltransferase [Amnibacterium setariae]
MPRSVTAILIAADGADHLRDTLDAITMQTRLPDRLVVVQLGTSPVTSTIIDGVEPTVHARVAVRATFGHAVETGVKSAGIDATEHEWLWLLASDNAPEPAALERLLQAVEAAPSVVVAGPKQMQWDAPAYLHSYGETMTPWGTAVEMAEPELDQGQYDRHSDVLAVAAGGMLVQAAAWKQLGGFDRALPAIDDALDFCVRARLAGHRVALVPNARVRSAGPDAPGTRLLGASTTEARRVRLAREAQLHRRLVYAALPLVPLHWLSILPIAVVRALGQILRKRPGSAPAELLAALVVMGTRFAAIARSRSRIARDRQAGWAAIAPLRQTWREVRHRRALARDNGRPANHDESLHFFTSGGMATVLAVGALAVVLFQPLVGAAAITGGQLLPLGSIESLWRNVGWGVHPLGGGFVGPADPFNAVLAVLGSITFWHPSAAVVGLWLLALPIAAAGGWLATARFTKRRPLRVVGGLLWAFAPTLVVALDTGRIGGVLVHLAAPFVLLAAFRVRSSWTAAAWLGLLGALIAACSPVLLPLLFVAWVAAVALGLAVRTGERSRIARILPLPIPAAVLFLPLIAEQAMNGRLIGVLADPGPVVAPAEGAHLLGLPEGLFTVLQLASGWPSWASDAWEGLTAPLGLGAGASAAFVWALGVPLLLLALIGLFWPKQSVPIRIGVFGVGGLVFAVLATRLQVVADGSTPIPVWPGAGLSLAWLAALEAAVCGLDRLAAAANLPIGRGGRTPGRVRAGGAAVIGITAALAIAAAVSPLLVGVLLGTAHVKPGSTATVPALVAAEGAETPDLGMLTLTAQSDGGYRSRLTRGEGRTLETLSTLQTTAGFGETTGLARLAAGLVQPTGDDLAASLNAYRIGYVLLQGGAGAQSALAEARGALGANPLLSVVSTTADGTLYRFDDLRTTGPIRLLTGPSNTGSPIGVLVLLLQGIVFGVTALLALPTSRLTQRLRPLPAVQAPRADVRSIAPRPEPVVRTPEQVMARELQPAGAPAREEVGSWR